MRDWRSEERSPDLKPADYKAKKKQVGDIFIGKLEKLIPGIQDQIEHYEVGTSKTVARYTLNTKSTVKILTIEKGKELSLQSHKKRDEFWVVLDEGIKDGPLPIV
jgi:mannose-6-phosphate isomerase-like protein (cupin superfamily)